jgi:hypothetical protein
VQRADAALIVSGHRHASNTRAISSLGEPALAEALLRAVHDELLRARAGGHALGLDADDAARAALARHGGAVQRVDLLRALARGRGELVLGVAGGDRHLGAGALLAVADERGDVAASVSALNASESTTSSIASSMTSSKRGHVRALLLGAEVDEALELGVEELLGSVRLDPDHLLHIRHATRERLT